MLVNNSAVFPRHIEKALDNRGRYEHTVSRLVTKGDEKCIVDYRAETVITSPNTAQTTIFADTVELHKTDFVRQMWAVYTAASLTYIGMYADKEAAERELFNQAKSGRAAFIQAVWM